MKNSLNRIDVENFQKTQTILLKNKKIQQQIFNECDLKIFCKNLKEQENFKKRMFKKIITKKHSKITMLKINEDLF